MRLPYRNKQLIDLLEVTPNQKEGSADVPLLEAFAKGFQDGVRENLGRWN